ncbi:hypothetical protein PISMIDRAFT_19431 [Pisolithus microcarpus 441]|uniref:Uncharacterized protein n=1 Tax=Pisolithus microcarpus 441 TaxID=765257 RepID=A0A0C9Y386_9AGAM|nr:hypothetical protein PISMIDRAFT_19431 [Pisolithus microcarpus 441]
MPAIVNLADKTACLIKHTPYDELHCHISCLECELEDTSYDLRCALRKVNDLQHAPAPTIPAPTTVEQAAHDFEHACVTSLGGCISSSNVEAGPSRLAPQPAPQPSPSSRGRVQAKPALQVEPVVSKKGKNREPEDIHQAMPEYNIAIVEEENTSVQIYDNTAMVIDTAVQGTLFPEFTGRERLYQVLCLGEGKDSMRKILFLRFNDNLYTYSDDRIGAALANIKQGTPPPLPVRQGSFVIPVTRWDKGMMGPIRLVNTAEDIHRLYARAYEEPEEKAPCIRKAQELITYINLWKKCRLETNEVMDLALKEWRPPTWASQKACQRREALRDKERARREEEALRSQPTGGQPALQQRIEGQPATPLPEMGQRPIVPLRDCLVFNPRGGGGRPSGRKAKGGIPELPREAPSLEAPVIDWVNFINTYQNRYNGSDESSELSKMFPGVLGISEHLDDNEWDISPPTAQQMVWFWELVRLLAAKGRYRALLDWAEVAPLDSSHVPWEGEFTRSATVADVAAYLMANSITPHNADDALIWARRVGNEYITHTVNNGGEQDPNVRAVLDLLRAAVNDPPTLKENCSKEWVEGQARALGISTECIKAYKARPLNEGELPIVKDFATAALLYDLPHYSGVEG